MGSLVSLALGPFEVDWGKNNHINLHGELFQPSDITLVQDFYVDNDGERFTKIQQGASKLLKDVLPRLELLGYTLNAVQDEFEFLMRLLGEEDDPPIKFHELADAIKCMDIDAAAMDYHEDYDLGEFFARQVFDRLGLGAHAADSRRYELGQVMENLSPYAVLRLLAENPDNLSRAVTWHYNDVVENGWVDAETISASIGNVRRYLIVTEGSSDVHILRRALELLRPATADFFVFVDMEEGYPFTGTGNLHKFCQGLVAIGIENRVVVLYDNDLEGAMRCADTNGLNLPPNMRVTKLPSLPALDSFRTIGPNGTELADINGKAASIECYLDLAFGTSETPRVRWSTYIEKADGYQGALMYKESYARRFMTLRHRESAYDFSKLEAVLDHLFEVCFAVAETSKLTETGRELGRV
ncbi:HEPN/Toprim-associated domain-containing protein [Luteimonas aquatica]|uniref:HEPN/Toprim-associated domain-containing protein n=1 Tax=Luteimonas aquatica TaxID=450364 RepID=UPI001F575364|nr:HEPN/Toprim-associated domain-containing protein [Luteimonas aquatica]